MCSIIPTSELISIFISRQFTMLSFNIGILHNLHKHNAKQRLKRCRRQQKKAVALSSTMIATAFAYLQQAPYCIYISAFFITTAIAFFNFRMSLLLHLTSHFYAKLNSYYCSIFNYKYTALYRAFIKNLMPVISTSTLASFIKMPDCSLCAKATPP